MTRPPRLSDSQLEEALHSLEGWGLQDGKLHREYRFGDFSRAFAFMTRCALAAEQLDHHPEWFNVYNRVVVDLQTHDAGGITQLDLELARRMDAYAQDK